MKELVLRFLLHRANTDPPIAAREEFYRLKDLLLERYATRDGADVQEIVKECWGYSYDYTCPGSSCTKCGGTGVFDRFYVLLHRYRWGRHVFHRPGQRSRFRGDLTITIRGRIRHARYGRSASEARLWLYALTGEWKLLLRSLTNGASCGWYLWPLLNVQRFGFTISMLPARYRNWRWQRYWNRERVRPIEDAELPF